MKKMTLGVLTLAVVYWCLLSGNSATSESPKPLEPIQEKVTLTEPKRAHLANALPQARPVERRIGDSTPSLPTPQPYAAAEPGDWRTLPLSTSFSISKGWSNWLCADLEGTPAKSIWRLQDSSEDKAEVHPGSCEEWDKKSIANAQVPDNYFYEDIIN